tara:strand:+ start:176 stop:1624 length:1449 start_codon:yes stop_codon:yes gene_type:complete
MFNHQPFRLIGVESNSGLKPIQKNLSKIRAYLNINKNLSLPYELSSFNLKELNRSNSLVKEAENKILLDSNKIKYALFWFVSENSFDEIALKSLNNGDSIKSEEIWRNVIKGKAISEKNFSAYNNLSTLLFLKSLSKEKNDSFQTNNESKKNLIESLNLKGDLIFSDHLFNFSKLICGNKNEITREDALSFFNESLSQMLNKNFTKSEISKIINKSNKELSDSFTYSLISIPLTNLEDLITDANDSLNQDNSMGLEIGKELIKKTLSDLKLLKDILGVDNIRYQSISDKLANQIMQCGILYFNKTTDDKEYLSSYEYALTISTKDKSKDRARETIKHCKEQQEAKVCKFCNSKEISKLCIRVEMHKMNFDNTYSYFKNGGLEINACNSCKKNISLLENKAGIFTFLIYALLNGLSILIFLGEDKDLIIPIILIIDIILIRFATMFWIWKFIYKQFKKPYLEFLSKHPLIISMKTQGYQFGMP